MKCIRNVLTAAAAITIVVCATAAAFAVTGDDILNRMQDTFSIGGADSGEGILLSIAVLNQYGSGITTDYNLAVAAETIIDPKKPSDADETSHALMYFVGGDDEGMIFLLSTPEAKSEKSRMWLYISSFGLTKELVSDEDQSGNFAGSTLSYADIAGAGDLRDDYSATILREETIVVGSEERAVWVLELTPKPGVDTDYARMLLWVDKEEDMFLRLEGYNASGARTKEIVVASLGTFEDRRIPDVMVGRDLETGDVSTITLSGIRRPAGGLPEGTFDPANLGRFDPSAYGF
ncbi:MAG: outer membrane lipoprotein-sorting protein [Candidatus Bipolaricaulis sp.]|nr:outer membrane lipoprotein-sorting protein [Candidatus Bipolaricaulis sp.]